MLKVDASSFFKGMAKLEQKATAGVTLAGKIAADKMATQAKQTAPWVDRTGHARRSIKGYTEWETFTKFRIGLSAGMDYSQYLELAMDKKYAILYPTLLANQEDILKAMGNIIK